MAVLFFLDEDVHCRTVESVVIL